MVPAASAQTLPTLSIADASATEGSAVTFTVTLSATSTDEVTVSYDTSDGTAKSSDGDYTAQSDQTLTIAVGTTTATISVPTGNDPTDEDDETFTVTLSSPTNATLGTASSATGTITDNDDEPTLSIANASATEGSDVRFTVTLSNSSANNVTVAYNTSDGTATTGDADYTAQTNETLTIAPGATTATIAVPTGDDTTDENDETFTLTLSNPTNATLGTANSATGTITDNDDPPTVSIANASATEGSAVTFTVTLSNASVNSVTVAYSTSNGTATTSTEAVGGADYTAQSGTLTFAAGATSRTLSVTTRDDDTDEDNENFTVTLSSPTNATLGSTDAAKAATGTINDNDDAPTLNIANASATEGSDVRFNVTVSKASGRQITVAYNTSNGTATTATDAIGGADYTAQTNKTLTIAPGTTTTISVPTGNDTTHENNETFTLTLSNPTNVTLGTAAATGTINDNDPEPTLSIASASAAEGSNVDFTVTLSNSSVDIVTVDYDTSNGTATTSTSEVGGPDYTARTGQTLTIAAGATSATISVSTENDTTDEDNETFTVTLASPNNATLGTPKAATGTINDNDPAPTLSIANASATEGSRVGFPVTVSAASAKQITVAYSTSNGTATTSTGAVGGADYTAQTSQTLTFSAGTTTATISVPTGDDTTDEDNETFTVTLASPTNATLGTAEATGTINDNDPAPALSIADASATEGSNVSFPVTVSKASGRQITVAYSTSNGTATTATSAPGGADYTAQSGTLTFSAGATSRTITVSTTDDDTDERNETFTVTLSSSPTNATVSTAQATGTVNDNDATPTVTLSLDSSIAEDDGSSTVSASLDHPSGFDTTLTVAYAAVSPAVPGDLTQSGTTLTIAAGGTSSTGTVTLTPVDNRTDAPDKGFTVSATATNALAITAPANVTLTVTDDDPAPSVTLTLSEVSIDETGGETVVGATLSHPSSEATTVTVAPSEGVYTLSAGGVLTIPAGDETSAGTVTLTATDNPTDAPDNELQLTATAMNSQGIVQPEAVDLTIEDDDPPPTVTLVLSADTIVEDGGTATVGAMLSHPSSEHTDVTVATAGGDAKAASFTLTGATLTIAAGATESSTSATVTPTDNNVDAPDQTVTVSATAANTQGIMEDPPSILTLTLTITDDEEAPTVTLALSAPTIAEGTAPGISHLEAASSGSTTVTASQSHPSSEATTLTVSATPVSPALAGDISQTGTTLTIAAGQTASTGTVTVAAVPNYVDTADRTVTIAATADNTQGIAGDPSSLTLTITDDDVRGFRWSPESATIAESHNATRDAFTLVLTSQPSVNVKVVFRVPGGANRLGFFAGSPIRRVYDLIFTTENWSVPRTVALLAPHDDDAANEEIVVVHRAGGVNATDGEEYEDYTDSYTITVIDDERKAENVLLSVSPSTAVEDGGAVTSTLKATLDGTARSDPVDVAVTVAEGTAAATDFTASPDTFTITIPANSISAERDFTLTPTADRVDEVDETVSIGGTTTATVEDSTALLTVSPAEVTITDDDTRGIRVSQRATRVNQAGTARWTVALSSQPTEAVTVAMEVSGVAPETLTMDPADGNLTFTVDDWNAARTVTLQVVPPGLYQGAETATVSHTASGGDYSDASGEAVAVSLAYQATVAPPAPTPVLADTKVEGDRLSLTYDQALDEGSVPAPEDFEVIAGPADGNGAPAAGAAGRPTKSTERIDVVGVEVAGAALTLTLSRPVQPGEQLTVSYTPGANPIRGVAGVEAPALSGTTVTPQVPSGTPGLHIAHFDSTATGIRQGFVRVVNRSEEDGVVRIVAVDEAGTRSRELTLLIAARAARHFNSRDLEQGNADKGLLPPGAGAPGRGAWRLEFRSALDIAALGYARTADGFVTSLHDTAPLADGVHRIAFFNPARNRSQESRLRLVNPSDEEALADIAGIDDDGIDSGRVQVAIPAGETAVLSAAALEAGTGEGVTGALGDGAGKWRLSVRSDAPLLVASLIRSPEGQLTNLSSAPATPGARPDTLGVPFFPAAGGKWQGFVRVINRSDDEGTVTIQPYNDSDRDYDPLTLELGAREAAHFNSGDLEEGADRKGLSGRTGEGVGPWRLDFESALDIEVLAYLRTPHDGFLTSMHDLAPVSQGEHRVVFFNPGSNSNQVSRLALVNPGAQDAAVTVTGTDDDGESPGTAVQLTVPAGSILMPTAAELERGDGDGIVRGALGDGRGKWRLAVSAERPLLVMSLLESPTGHLTNLSASPEHGAPTAQDRHE